MGCVPSKKNKQIEKKIDQPKSPINRNDSACISSVKILIDAGALTPGEIKDFVVEKRKVTASSFKHIHRHYSEDRII